MGRTEQSIIIKAPPEQVWELPAFDRLPEWEENYSHHVRVDYTSEVHTPQDKYRVGATAQGIPKKPGEDYCRFEMIESLEHEKMTFRAWEKTKYYGTLSMIITYSLEPVGTNTKFTYELESEKFLGIFGELLERLYLRRWAEKQMLKALENLKTILEQ
jgi:hypothetical protein